MANIIKWLLVKPFDVTQVESLKSNNHKLGFNNLF